MSTYPNISGAMRHTEDNKFRGRWAPQIATPKPKFYVIAQPAKPATKTPAPVAAAPPPKVTKPTVPAPSDAKFTIIDRMKNFRSYMTEDGACYNSVGDVLGYIEQSSWEAGSADGKFLGRLRDDNFVENAVEVVVGCVDLGRALIRDDQDTIVCEMTGTGEVYGHQGSYIGAFDNFDYHHMKIITLYLLLIDPGMLSEIEG
ncbi:hypothetical protein Pelo_8228 [Pelomyxa schiedti]|nr:hypothetical protein Pelo_8228 [Pelomyxa schiedti]